MSANPETVLHERVLLEIRDHIATVTLNRPDQRNALDIGMFDGIVAAAAAIAEEPDVRAVVLTGAGPAFCAGLDVKSMMTNPAAIERLLMKAPGELTNLAQRVCWAWRELPVPVIAALKGEVFGGGLQIALGADIRLAMPDARLSVMEIRWGLIPDMGGSRVLKDIMPLDVAKELALTGRIVDGEEGVGMGLVTRVCADPLAAARELAGEIAARSPDAIRSTKYLFDRAPTLNDPDGLALETQLQMALIGQKNQLEAVRAGMARTVPDFQPASVDPAKVEGGAPPSA